MKNNRVTLSDFAILVLLAWFAALAQCCLKVGGTAARAEGQRVRASLAILAGLTLFGGCVVAQAFMMRRIPLILITPVSALIYVFVPLLSHLFLRERVRSRFWLGVLSIVAGIALLGRSF
jgi:drug/metabolite transporter (DMT)-like permease